MLKALRQHNNILLALLVSISLIAGVVAVQQATNTGIEIAFAGGGGGGGGGGAGADACGPTGPSGAPGMGGGCGCDGAASGGHGGDGDGDGGGGGGPVCTTSQCISAANVCGDVSIGTQNSCTGICSASVPANPSGSCSVATACGVNATGFNGCSGQCNITQYPFCLTTQNPDGDGEIEWITLDDGSGDGSGLGVTDVFAQIFAKPTLVAPGASTVIRWLSVETESCDVIGENGDLFDGVRGEQLSGPILQETVYTLTCEGYDGSTVTDSVRVRIVPDWEEF